MSTHHQLLYHIVFSTKNRKPYLQPGTQAEMFAYLGGTVKGLDGIPIRIGGWVDHVHLLIRLKTTHQLSSFVRDLKSSSSRKFNEQGRKVAKFGWQDGFGAFTVSPSMVDDVVRYIERQEEHHKKQSFQAEYIRMLDRHGVQYDPRYVFD